MVFWPLLGLMGKDKSFNNDGIHSYCLRLACKRVFLLPRHHSELEPTRVLVLLDFLSDVSARLRHTIR